MQSIQQIHDHVYKILRSLGEDYALLYEPWLDDDDKQAMLDSFNSLDGSFYLADWNDTGSELEILSSVLENLNHHDESMTFDQIAEEFEPEDVDEDEYDERYSGHEWQDSKNYKIKELIKFIKAEMDIRK